MTPRQLRILRGAAASTSATLIAALSHTIGGGAFPHPLLIGAVCVLLAPVAALLVGRATRLVSIAAAVGVTQGLFHVLFELTGSTLATAGGLGVHQHGPIALTPLVRVSHADTPMTSAHLVAAVFTALMLWRGELILRTIANWIRVALRSPDPSTPRHTTQRPELPHRQSVLPKRLALGDISRRGPPALSCG